MKRTERSLKRPSSNPGKSIRAEHIWDEVPFREHSEVFLEVSMGFHSVARVHVMQAPPNESRPHPKALMDCGAASRNLDESCPSPLGQ